MKLDKENYLNSVARLSPEHRRIVWPHLHKLAAYNKDLETLLWLKRKAKELNMKWSVKKTLV